jgi:hypothetical protein
VTGLPFYAPILRVLAIAIAVAAIVDPAVATSTGRPRLAVVLQEQGSPAAAAVEARLSTTLGKTYEIVPHITSDAAAAIVIGDRYPDQDVPAGLVAATVTIAETTPSVRIVSLTAPSESPEATAIRIDAEIEASGAAGRSTDLVVSIGGLEVGRRSHRWSQALERWHAAIDVVPVGDSPWIIQAAATSDAVASAAQTVVARRREPLAVEIYEPRPSWATTFVRRALESDARFRVESLSVSSRGISSRTPGSRALDNPQLDSFDVVVAGGLERLSAADVRALERFMRERGGAVALLPDARMNTGAARDLLRLETTERLLERPERLSTVSGAPPLDASELLLLDGPAARPADVVARASDASPVILSMPHGRGRLFVSGAMDAWRYRASADRAFDRFWQAVLAGLALGSRPRIDVLVSPPLLRPLQRAVLLVRVRDGWEAPVSASVGGETVRLWPEPEAGVYRGAFTAPATAGRITVEVSAAGARPDSVSRDVVVQEGHATPVRIRPPLALLAASHRGIDVPPERLGELEQFVRGRVIGPDEAGVQRPMRSTWWVLTFLVALSAEWVVRRRRGLQ